MPKETTKNRILTEGARIIYEKGFNNTGIQEILEAAGVPKGSFYFYFKSKEAFGLDLVDFYLQFILSVAESFLGSPSPEPLDRLKGFFEHMRSALQESGYRGGCPIGNLAQEMADQKEEFRIKVNQAFSRISVQIAQCLEGAKDLNQINPSLDPREAADFILNSWEGALLRMKTESGVQPLLLFENMIFQSLLKC